MLRIFICEDNALQLNNLTKLVDSFIKEDMQKMTITMKTQFPHELLAVLPFQNTTGLYFLDIDLNCDIDAYQLATAIRNHDPRAFIVIVTGDTTSRDTVFKRGVEAMDYIIKGTSDFNKRIKACLQNAYSRFVITSNIPNTVFNIKLAADFITKSEVILRGAILHLNSADVLYVDNKHSKSHHAYVHMLNNKRYLVRKTLKQLEKELRSVLVRCHISYLVNKNMIVSLDPLGKKLHLANGVTVDLGRRQFKNLLTLDNIEDIYKDMDAL